MRLRVLGNSEDAAATALSLEQDRQLRNPALRWLCHLVWRTGVELQPEVVLRIVIVIALIIPLALFILGLFVGTAFVVFALIIGWFILAQRAARRPPHLIDPLPAFLNSTIHVLAAANTLDE